MKNERAHGLPAAIVMLYTASATARWSGWSEHPLQFFPSKLCRIRSKSGEFTRVVASYGAYAFMAAATVSYRSAQLKYVVEPSTADREEISPSRSFSKDWNPVEGKPFPSEFPSGRRM